MHKEGVTVDALTDQQAIDDVVNYIRNEARRRNVRWTNQRQCIVEVFIKSEGHATVEDLARLVRTVDPSVSAATIYRTVNLLVDIGVAVKRDFGQASASFECVVDKQHHHHLIDMRSGAIIEFSSSELERVKEKIAAELGFRLVHHHLELFGVPLGESVPGRANEPE